MLLRSSKRIKCLEHDANVYILINVHENVPFLYKQLQNIETHFHCKWTLILNCNKYMFNQLKDTELSIYCLPWSSEKSRFHGSLLHGIFQSMAYLHKNVSKFDYVLVLSSRNFFRRVINMYDLRKIEAKQKRMHTLNTKLTRWKGNKFYKLNTEKENEWWWPYFSKTHFASKYEFLVGGFHEGLLLNYKTVGFLIHELETQYDIFKENLPMEEFVIQTVCRNENLPYAQLSEHDDYVLKEAPIMKVERR